MKRSPPAAATFLPALENDHTAASLLLTRCLQASRELRRQFPPATRAPSLHLAQRPARDREAARLKQEFPQISRPYGGLSWVEVENLVRHYQSGSMEVGVFLLAQMWSEGSAGAANPAALLAAEKFLDAVIHGRRVLLLRQLGKVLQTLSQRGAKLQRSALGYQERWKVSVLIFLLRHPRRFYRVRDLRQHLEQRGLEISPKDIRRFCARHGIRRDVRAGRPRQALTLRQSSPASRKL